MTEPLGAGSFRDTLTAVSNNWGRVVFLGVLDVIAGILALVWPVSAVLVLAIMLGIAVLMSAIGSLAIGFRAKNGWMIAWGVLALIAGIIFLLRPGTGIWVIAVAAVVYFLMTGIADLTLAFSPVPGRWVFGLLGVISIIGAIILLMNPGLAVLTVAVIIGVTFLARGLGEISTGLWLRRQRTA